MPNRQTVISLMDMLTSTKLDHRDLQLSHVWVFPSFVLNHELQNNLKIPKWSRRSQLGSFVGFSNEHFMLVVNVRNLCTGYVSIWYHCVFDDLFKTAFISI